MLEAISPKKSEVDILLELQRDQSDARSIINEVERLKSFEGVHRYRWIWELLQNARDEAGNGIDVVCELEGSRFRFLHNGQPFESGHLLALTRKTSTKPIDGSNGNAGKFGTGFVTSHLLSKEVKIKGIHENAFGKRQFDLVLDRTPEQLEGMMKSIAASIQRIREIDITPSADSLEGVWNEFEYQLGDTGIEVAHGGINQLEKNLAFTLLVNKQIKSVEIIQNGVKKYYTADIVKNALGDLSFVHLIDKYKSSETNGLLFKKAGDLLIAAPAEKLAEGFRLISIGDSSRLFKELPLIGTEDPFLPVIFQHKSFQPTEPRDGVRTKIVNDSEGSIDLTATKNRNAFHDLIAEFSSFIISLREGQVLNLHHLAETDLPSRIDSYYDRQWYSTEIQQPLRKTLLEHPLVRTVSGSYIQINAAVFPQLDSPNNSNALYDLISRLYPGQCPDRDSYNDWNRIINQDQEGWPTGIVVNAKHLAENAVNKSNLALRFEDSNSSVKWLQDFILYLEQSEQERLGFEFALYPNQLGDLTTQDKVFHDTGIDAQFKKIAAGLGRQLEAELLPSGFTARFVADFNMKEFVLDLNDTIGSLKPEAAAPHQIQAIIDFCCTLKPTRAEKRDQWFDILNRLLPNQAPSKVYINTEEEFSWDTAEKWALKYICSLVQQSESVQQFAQHYFNNNEVLTFSWLNDLLNFIFRNEDNKDTGLKYRIVPTQDGKFKIYNEFLYQENNPSEAANIIKDLFRDYTSKGDPRTFLVHSEINNEAIRKADLILLTRVLDDLFNPREAEDFVKEGGKYHKLFLQLKEWLEVYTGGDDLFPIFSKKQPILYIKAFGEGSSLGRLLKLKKSVEDIEQLDKLSLTTSQMKQLDEAVTKIGNAQSLIDKANEMAVLAEEVRWRQKVGKAAEDAFVEAMAEANPHFAYPENPDDGKDFIIRINGKEYALELKSAIESRETVKMSLKQGETAVSEKGAYALCVISRPFEELTNKEQFIERARFVTNISEQIGDKIIAWRTNLSRLDIEDEVTVQLDNKSGSINIRKSVWKDSMPFSEFVKYLETFFEIV